MNLKKSIMLCCVVSLLCLCIFTGCRNEDDYVSQATKSAASTSESQSSASEESSEITETGGAIDPKVAQELRDGVSLQPGAKTEDSVDENGNQTFTYSNPDGTGGGGVALD